jgi:hypothetical protein
LEAENGASGGCFWRSFSSSSFATASSQFNAATIAVSGQRHPWIPRQPLYRAAALLAALRQDLTVHDSGVGLWSASLDSTSVPFSSSGFTTASRPFSAARPSSVRPLLDLYTTSAPLSSSSFTTASCPFSAAHDSGIRLLQELCSTSAPSRVAASQLPYVPSLQPTRAASDNR